MKLEMENLKWKKRMELQKIAIILAESIINGQFLFLFYPFLINMNEIVERDLNPHLFYKLG
jgi:hypothetical protein